MDFADSSSPTYRGVLGQLHSLLEPHFPIYTNGINIHLQGDKKQ